MRKHLPGLVRVAACGLALLVGAATFSQINFGGKGLFGGGGDDDALSASAEILPDEAGRPARLQVTARLQSGWHTFSITQSADGLGPTRTKIKVARSPLYTLGPFKAITPPANHPEPSFDNLVVEEHSGEAVWEAPLSLPSDVKDLRITGSVFAQVCKGQTKCLPPTDYPFEATLGDPSKLPAGGTSAPGEPALAGGSEKAPGGHELTPGGEGAGSAHNDAPRLGSFDFTRPGSHAALRGAVTPAAVAPGGKARIVISAAPEPPFHLYAIAESVGEGDNAARRQPTHISLRPTPGLTFAEPRAAIPVITHPNPDVPLGVERYYSGAVDFVVDVEVAADAAPGKYPIEGVISFQTSTLGKKDEARIDKPVGARFQATLDVAAGQAVAANDAPPERIWFEGARYNQRPEDASVPKDAVAASGPRATAAGLPEKLIIIELNSSQEKSLIMVLMFSFLGGLILNLMPCVLPVIGLKLLSFVSQAGQHRGRVLALNLWYTAGLLTVFAALAALAAFAKQGWGEHFNSPVFGVSVCGVVFAMALSFVGVWEIPLPGFVGSGKGTELAAQEGFIGAYFKGMMSTVLATPCSGPFLGAVFTFTLNKPVAVIFLVYGFIGLGMASPYLLIGAFPALIRWLPKPGAWMDTFKQAMGFTLLATAVYLVSILNADYRMPTLALLLAIGVACWWVGREPLYAEPPRKLRTWAQAAAMAGVIGYVGFNALAEHRALLNWKKFTASEARELAAAGKTVMVDFTASWCPTCHTNLALAINTAAVAETVKQNGVVPMLADWSDRSPEIHDVLEKLDSRSIPVLAIFPAGRPGEALLLRDLITERQVLMALERAGASFDASGEAPDEPLVTSVEPAKAGSSR